MNAVNIESGQILFYVSGSIAVLASLFVVTNKNAVHALLYLVVSLLALAMCFYLLGAPFAAALQIIVYAGAIMVLFVFAVMIFNINQTDIEREKQWLTWQSWVGPSLLAMVLLGEIVFVILSQQNCSAVAGTRRNRSREPPPGKHRSASCRSQIEIRRWRGGRIPVSCKSRPGPRSR